MLKKHLSNLNLAPNNIHNFGNCKEQPLPQPLTPGKGTPASEGPPTGRETSTPSPTAGDGEGEVDVGATTSASLLATIQGLAVSSNYFMCKPNIHEVTLNPAPTGSLNR